MFFVESRTNQLGLCRYIYPFFATDLFRSPPPPLCGFLMFSGGIKIDLWNEMG